MIQDRRRQSCADKEVPDLLVGRAISNGATSISGTPGVATFTQVTDLDVDAAYNKVWRCVAKAFHEYYPVLIPDLEEMSRAL